MSSKKVKESEKKMKVVQETIKYVDKVIVIMYKRTIMDIASKEFPGKLIAWALMIGAAIIFYDVFMDMAYDSLTACELVEESLDKFFSFWEGEYYGS